jgi:hypothetical protein
MSYFDDKDAAEILGHGTLGFDASDIASLIAAAPTLLKTARAGANVGARVIADPHLQEVLCEGFRVINVLDNKPAGKACRRTGPVSQARMDRGIGLKGGLLPARAFIFHRENPWVLPVAIGGTVGLLFLAGYFIGKGRKK